MKPFTFGSLFAGIGGFDLGFERAGMTCSWQVERDPFCLKVLNRHFPNVPKHDDIHTVGSHNLSSVDLICGGFPCQPFSSAGKQLGEADDRNLWLEMRRVIAELKPHYIVAENVLGLVGLYLDTVLSDLESEGYEVGTVVLPVGAFGASHQRHRVFILAHAQSRGCHWGRLSDRNQYEAVLEESETGWRRETQRFQSELKRGTSGRIYALPNTGTQRIPSRLSTELDTARLKALGNSVSPVVVEHIGNLIMSLERQLQSCL